MSEKTIGMAKGIALVFLTSCVAYLLAQTSVIRSLSFSPLIVGIGLGMIFANTLRSRMPESWNPGLAFCAKRILRCGIVFYGFKLTFQQVLDVGAAAVIIDAIVVAVTILGGLFAGRLLGMDRDTALLTSAGSAICGAAAVLGAESSIKAQPYKTAVAVSTVVIFGTISMFLYPILYRSGMLDLSPQGMGIFTGATVHEVAHVVGAGNAIGAEGSDTAVITKMIRVMMLVPVLLVISMFWNRTGGAEGANGAKGSVQVPWFAVMFLGVVGFNSLDLLPGSVVEGINFADTFMLTMAMVALGMDTGIEKFKKAGSKPFILAGILYVWLLFGGYALMKLFGF